ncbi:MAG: hypothetical protein LAT75_12710 [Candidatus Cyclonatronum sp.]|uniref:hypothetical protein n=1 Tax=Cyclonatronum sp. TaxID=3024185 RepID=UPI0025BA16D6|nr:hypothetical protein [Cyclonatronum sp.]MCC5933728.1 hypothetical protein [Balneolales bacterium]MCH8487722.1 hypothetical protein [Cyclonatronum sp.]
MPLTHETAFLSLLLLNLVSCAFMCGLTTFVQLVHYPGFVFADSQSGTVFHDFHSGRTALVAGVPMLAELFSGIALITLSFGSSLFWAFVLSGVLLAYIWGETAFRVIPVHNKMSITGAHNAQLVQRLSRANLPRTLAWNLRVLLLSSLTLFILYGGPYYL